MASLGRSRSLAEQADKENDPFVTVSPQPPLRFSGFDSKLFALGPASSPHHAKRALEAHLVETERRMAEAGKLGTALVQQQKELRDRLAEVEGLESEGQLSAELRHKLVEIERDYNDVAKQTARAFLPKQRVPSNEATGSPYVPDGKGTRVRHLRPRTARRLLLTTCCYSVPSARPNSKPKRLVLRRN
jgi:hypothetical protein